MQRRSRARFLICVLTSVRLRRLSSVLTSVLALSGRITTFPIRRCRPGFPCQTHTVQWKYSLTSLLPLFCLVRPHGDVACEPLLLCGGCQCLSCFSCVHGLLAFGVVSWSTTQESLVSVHVMCRMAIFENNLVFSLFFRSLSEVGGLVHLRPWRSRLRHCTP